MSRTFAVAVIAVASVSRVAGEIRWRSRSLLRGADREGSQEGQGEKPAARTGGPSWGSRGHGVKKMVRLAKHTG
jgi:hypothetical protein